MRDGEKVESAGRFEVLNVEAMSSLRISPVIMEDAGDLACHATNSAGRAQSNATLSVHGKSRSISQVSRL